MKHFGIRSVDLRRVDTLNFDAIVLPIFQEKAQLLGVAGLLDWRLCGRLSRLLVEEKFEGRDKEVILLSYASKIGQKNLFLYGLGPSRKLDAATSRDHLIRMLDVAAKSGAKSAAIATSPRQDIECLRHWLQTPKLSGAKLNSLTILTEEQTLVEYKNEITALLKKSGLERLLKRPASAKRASQPEKAEANQK
ncbi:MAG: M17 family peptidase N-terminal domain-containing protein [Myxococcota bacterium]|nr:M17 family peptidase N-terminal domain-containing protein [Myxococcota bacterium]